MLSVPLPGPWPPTVIAFAVSVLMPKSHAPLFGGPQGNETPCEMQNQLVVVENQFPVPPSEIAGFWPAATSSRRMIAIATANN